jgi:signal transduction histidine kinase
VLHEAGLFAALEWLSTHMRERHGLTVQVRGEGKVCPAAKDVSILLYQSVRELLFNVVKHAGVKMAELHMECRDGQWLRIVVADQGAGFDAAHPRRNGGGFGLFSIRERLELLGGRFEIDSAPGHGARMILTAPLTTPAA